MTKKFLKFVNRYKAQLLNTVAARFPGLLPKRNRRQEWAKLVTNSKELERNVMINPETGLHSAVGHGGEFFMKAKGAKWHEVNEKGAKMRWAIKRQGVTFFSCLPKEVCDWYGITTANQVKILSLSNNGKSAKEIANYIRSI